jgi:hypothetical protein
MRKRFIISAVNLLLASSLSFSLINNAYSAGSGGWRAGTATAVITPEQSIWLAGYGARNRPSEGTETELYSKALAIEDAKGKKAVLITNDLVKVPKNISDRIRNRIGAKYGLTRSQIILNCSHTHSGPVLYNAYSNAYSTIGEEQKSRIRSYSEKYENQIVELVGEAIASLQPVTIYSQNGVVRFQVNRRNNVEKDLTPFTELNGPNDYAVPVIKVVGGSGNIIAVAFGYACHATVTDQYKWSGDYPGFAQAEIEKLHPGATALFFQGAGADQNPLPRRSIALAKQYGRQLAAAVERVLSEEMKPLEPQLSAAYTEIELPYTGLPSKEELSSIASESSGYPAWHKTWASSMLEKLSKGEKIESAYRYYPIQIWKLGEQPIMTLGGELVVEYAIKLKEIFGPDIFVMGYTNDIMSYIPSPTILKEGGYEGIRSHLSSGLPGTYKAEIEANILNGMIRLAKQTGVITLQEKQLKAQTIP